MQKNTKCDSGVERLRLEFSRMPPAAVFCGKEYFEGADGKRALTTLLRDGDLFSVASGYYAKRLPEISPWTTALHLSGAIAESLGLALQPTPRMASRLLGLEAPTPEESLTWFVARTISARITRGRELIFYRGTKTEMLGAGSLSGVLLQAMRHYGYAGKPRDQCATQIAPALPKSLWKRGLSDCPVMKDHEALAAHIIASAPNDVPNIRSAPLFALKPFNDWI